MIEHPLSVRSEHLFETLARSRADLTLARSQQLCEHPHPLCSLRLHPSLGQWCEGARDHGRVVGGVLGALHDLVTHLVEPTFLLSPKLLVHQAHDLANRFRRTDTELVDQSGWDEYRAVVTVLLPEV